MPSPAFTYRRRTPEETVVYRAVAGELPAVRSLLREAGDGQGLPAFIDRAVEAYLGCGLLRHGSAVT